MTPDDEGPYTTINEGPPQEEWVPRSVIAPLPEGTNVIRAIPLTSLEAKAETWSLEALLEKRKKLVAKMRPLEYIFGSGRDNEQSIRRRHRDGIQRLMMQEAKDKNEPVPTEKKLEALANSDPRHVAFCDRLEEQFAEWYELKNELQDVQDQILDRELSVRAYTKEIGLQ